METRDEIFRLLFMALNFSYNIEHLKLDSDEFLLISDITKGLSNIKIGKKSCQVE